MGGNNVLFSHGINCSAGVMILFNKFTGKVISHVGDKDEHWLIAAIETCDRKFTVLSI